MNDSAPIINLGDLAKPATVLIEKISEAVGAIYRPTQIKRIAKAEGEAAKVTAVAALEVAEIEQRGLSRFIQQEARYQKNFDSIVAQSIPELNSNAEPENIENDWLARFFEESKLVSDEEMQTLWAQILAGEANKVGTFSKRTLQFLSGIDRHDANSFTSLMSFAWLIDDELHPVVLGLHNQIYGNQGINFTSLKH